MSQIDPIEFVKASQACGDAISRFSCYLEDKFELNEWEAAWVMAIFIHSLPKTVDDNPSLKSALNLVSTKIKQTSIAEKN